jgi:hypothetical protein
LDGQELYLWSIELLMLGGILVLELVMWLDGRKASQKRAAAGQNDPTRP